MSILILGGGISGLSAAWYARKANPKARITLLEKSKRLGGCIETSGMGFEKGPRTFVVGRSAALLQLIHEVGLQDELIFSKHAPRYLLSDGRLRSMTSFLPMLAFPLLREAFIPKKMPDDESIFDFAVRRFNKNIAETLFDPLTLGIFAGDIRKLSLCSCFPFLHEWEGTILRKLFAKKQDSRLFTLRRGMGSLIEAMQQRLDVDFVMDAPVEAMTCEGVHARGKLWKADRIISALPGPVIGKLTGLWKDFPATSLWVVTVAFQNDLLARKGFGYLVPSKENETVLGCVWDSAIFPRSWQSMKTILTFMVRKSGDAAWAKEQALSALRRHLGLAALPDFMECSLAEEAIPQFEVGYAKRLQQFVTQAQGQMTLIGNYIGGPSVNACVQSARDK